MTVSFTDHVAILVTADLIDLELWSSYAQRATLTYAIFCSAGTKICIISTSFTRCSCFYHLLLWTLLLNYIINCHHYLHTMNAITTIICHHYLHTYWQRYQTSDIARSKRMVTWDALSATTPGEKWPSDFPIHCCRPIGPGQWIAGMVVVWLLCLSWMSLKIMGLHLTVGFKKAVSSIVASPDLLWDFLSHARQWMSLAKRF